MPYSKVQLFVSTLLFITINVLFYFKYLYRVSLPVAIVAVLFYLLFALFTLRLFNKGKLLLSDKLLFPLVGVYVVSCITVLFFIPKEILNVDRWEMIEVFWDAVSNGLYPYSAQSPGGNYPGPMPFYFTICYPFYLVGEIGLITLTSVLLCFYYYYKRVEKEAFTLMVLLLFSSLAIYWEIFARSTIFFNSLLFAFYYFSIKDLKDKNNKMFYLSAVLGGLLLSTRNVFVIPLIIWGGFMLFRERIQFVRLIKWGVCLIASFFLSLLPFVLLDPSEFMKMNPFVIQSSFLMPFSYVLLFIILSFIISVFCKKYTDVIFYSGVLLFCTITGHVFYAVHEEGIRAYLVEGADISYYIFCFPFLLEIMVNKYKVK